MFSTQILTTELIPELCKAGYFKEIVCLTAYKKYQTIRKYKKVNYMNSFIKNSPERWAQYHRLADSLATAKDRLLFSVATPLIRLGMKRPLEASDMPSVPKEYQPESGIALFQGLKPIETGASEQVSTIQAIRFLFQILWRVKRTFLTMCVYSLFLIALDLAGPILINRFLAVLSSSQFDAAALQRGVIYGLAIAIPGLATGILAQHYIYSLLTSNTLISSGLNHLLFQTSLKMTRHARQSRPAGDLVNLMGTDTDAVKDFPFALIEVISVFFQVLGASALMVYFLGSSGFVALAVLALLFPLSMWIAKKFVIFSDGVMLHRDRRVAHMSQSLYSIRVIKSFALEPWVLKKNQAIRDEEIAQRSKFLTISGLSVVLYRSMGTIIGGSVFGTMVYLGVPLTATEIFTGLALIAVMEGPFGSLTEWISILVSSKVSAVRIGTFLGIEQDASTSEASQSSKPSSYGVRFSKACYQFKDGESPVLKDISVEFKPGSATAIVGPLGSGKSTLLSAILRDVPKTAGDMEFSGVAQLDPSLSITPKLSFVSQDHFILNASLEDNIWFGNEPPPEKDLRKSQLHLEQALSLADLSKDIAIFQGGLSAEIGEHGINLSGGQKQRVALARAVIQDGDIILLDDVLSALDQDTEDKIVANLVFGKWHSKTRILVTHRLRHLDKFDTILFMENGEITSSGTLESLLEHSERFKVFYEEYLKSATQTDTSDSLYAQDEDLGKSILSVNQSHDDVSDLDNVSDQEMDGNFDDSTSEDDLDIKDSLGDLRVTEDEDRRKGAISKSTFLFYVQCMFSKKGTKSGASFASGALILFLLMLGSTLLPVLINAWLGAWGNSAQSLPSTAVPSTEGVHFRLDLVQILSTFVSGVSSQNLVVYWALAVAASVTCWIQFLIYSRGGLSAGRTIQNGVLKSILSAKLRFFDSTPIGRVLNRLGKDLDTVERQLPSSLEQSVRAAFQVALTLAIILLLLPLSIVVVVPILWLYYRLQLRYRKSSREAQRLYSIARSPVLSHFKETLSGIPVVRAFEKENYFELEFKTRMATLNQVFYGMIILNRWFSIRVTLLSSAITVTVALATAWSVHEGLFLAGSAGLVMIYGQRFWESLNWGVRSFSQLESQMTSFERLTKYLHLSKEEASRSWEIPPRREKVIGGAKIEFKDVLMRYAPHLPFILKGTSFKIESGERVGIVGRTGSGKSTVFHALLGFSDLEGEIYIDNRPTSSMTKSELRHQVSLVPQDPTMFLGTLRDNCDPFTQYIDSEIWEALERVKLADRVKISGGLGVSVVENGMNFSQGERQLICLARAILTQAPIILLDEATSGIDVETDARVQETIRTEFKGRTILAIAHRKATISDYDKIIEISEGRAIMLDQNPFANPEVPQRSLDSAKEKHLS